MNSTYTQPSRTQVHLSINDEQKNLLLSYSYSIAQARSKADLSSAINDRLKRVCGMKDYLISTIDEATHTHGSFLINANSHYARRADFKEMMNARFCINDGLANMVLNSADPVPFSIAGQAKRCDAPGYVAFWRAMGISKIVGVALRVGHQHIGILWIEPDKDADSEILTGGFFKGVVAQLAIALANILANERAAAHLKEIAHYKQQLAEERTYSQQQAYNTVSNKEVIGNSPQMLEVFNRVERVAYSDTTVLLLGETGTGKELIAQAIHAASPRKNRPMIKVNCAALPANLVESELFGHEKGSFTGATERRIGKFELADNSTLFLDEVGELPLEQQAKLLRALQEREIERIGGKSPIKVNIRIIAATNRDLLKEVAAGRFRSDLYYRLNVFPILLPPLRLRQTDLLPLARFFIKKFSGKLNRKVEGLSKKAEQELMAYDWPGNVRELEHVFERCVLMATGPTIKELNLFTDATDKPPGKYCSNTAVQTLEENEREHICHVLRLCNGKISGYFGAAGLLGVPVSTLNSKIVKLNIAKKQKVFSNGHQAVL
ncbi:sigma 54-interacting transcriptional regulator [Mucilaginibacter pedocola]|uniref:Sigma-54 factor interaction domain-containing protein n=1 Tax=Mucilaginibacter pedocola TaxID=1792845 RepID=A0A1S9P9Z4_9SPHI|nr:sigma 54-interacting transcriptional regulator [Mucilaginibacter pedocola]OOQ57772.1 hypothetical protein BC343_13365 [Mucilaginibacter pedocola]